MLQAILNGKITSSFLDSIKSGVSWKKAYIGYEDFLTAAVISRLSYLPERLFTQLIISSATPMMPSTMKFGEIKQIQFWPQWNVPHWMSNKARYREADVFICFGRYDLIIEAKRNDGKLQDILQWTEQLYSFLHNRQLNKEKKRPIIYWALGGMAESSSETQIKRLAHKLKDTIQYKYPNEDIYLIVSSWASLLSSMLRMQKDLLQQNSLAEQNPCLRIIDDAIEAMRLHGIREWNFLSETLKYWRKDGFSEKSIHYYRHITPLKPQLNAKNPINWKRLTSPKRNFDTAIEWFGDR